eukprot:6645258-Pyramimonas_sp.AAC.1
MCIRDSSSSSSFSSSSCYFPLSEFRSRTGGRGPRKVEEGKDPRGRGEKEEEEEEEEEEQEEQEEEEGRKEERK